MSFWRVTASSGFFLGVLFWVAGAAGHERAERFVGRFRYSGGAREGRALAEELDRVANKFSFFIRGIARKKLRQGIHPYSDVWVEKAGKSSRVSLGGRPALLCDGTSNPVIGEHGAPGVATCTFQNGAFVVRSVYELGVHTNVFWLSPDGKILRMKTTVSSPKLPDKVEFTVTYTRH